LKENNSFKDLNAINSFENSIESDFIEAMDDDFNSSAAISHMFNICKNLNSLIQSDDYTLEQKIKNLSEITSTVQRVYGVLGLFQQDPYEFVNNMMTKYLMKLNISNNEIENIIKERANAKLSKNYPLADDLRNVLLEKGIILNDSTNGTTWDLKDLYYV
jgi:cysteinyl-tRNA synthetase